jgi:hypothetical protein
MFNIKLQSENGAENEKMEGNIDHFQVVHIQRKRERDHGGNKGTWQCPL